MIKIKQLPSFNSDRFSYYNRKIINDVVNVASPIEYIQEADRHPMPVFETDYNIKPIVHENKPAAMIMGHDKTYQTKPQVSLIAGVLGHLVTANDPGSPQDGAPIRVAFPTPTDAASVVASSMTDYGNYNARSLVYNKADIVAMKASELVEIRSGGVPYLLANGAKNPNVYGGIHLISGDKTEGKDFDLQSMVKGENLVKFMKDFIKILRQTTSQIRELNKDVENLKKELADHTHKFKGVVTGTAPNGPITGTAKGTTVKSVKLASAIGKSMPKTTKISTSLSSLEKNYSRLMKNYLNSNSPTKIRSSFNKVN
jgi:hypothetical protein|tara:strand:+ start:2577 stop:3515 length:939 start_codon:yes stop_codon:yes gene_type:complete